MTVLDHIGLSVRDLESQSEWYSRALGLVPLEPARVPAIGLRVIFLVDPDRQWALELLHRPGSSAGLQALDAGEAVLTQGFGHICLRCDDVDQLYSELLAEGASSIMPPGPSPVLGVRMAFVADPEGHLIEILDRPGPPGTAVEPAWSR